MHRYTDHRGAQNASVKNVAGLENLKNGAIFVLADFLAVHSLVKMRIKRLADRVDAFRAELRDIVEQLFVDKLETFAIVFVLGLAMRGEGMLKTINDGDEPFNHPRRGAFGIFEAFFFNALAIIRKIGLAA